MIGIKKLIIGTNIIIFILSFIYIVNFQYKQYELKIKSEEIVNILKTPSSVSKSIFNSSINDKDVLGTLSIPSIKITYPIFNKETDYNLEIGIAKYEGPSFDAISGNIVLIGHNMRRSNLLFTNLDKVKNNDIIYITLIDGSIQKYKVFKSTIVLPDNLAPLSQETNSEKYLTLITCNDKGKDRLIVYSKLVK